MKRALATFVTALVLGSVLGLIAPARADDRAVRKSLDAIYAQYVQSFKAKDTTAFQKWLERYLTPDAVNSNPDGSTQSRQQIIDGLQKVGSSWRPARAVTGKIVRLTVSGNKATVLFADRIVRLIPDPRSTGGGAARVHQFVAVDTERDTWVKTPAGWKSTVSANLTSKVTLDGKPFRPQRARVSGP